MNIPAAGSTSHVSNPNAQALQAASLNQGQQDAADQIFQFLFTNDKEFSITGPAGTGKTHLMRYVIQNLLTDYDKAMVLLDQKPQSYTVALTATTNKAAEVLSKATGMVATTLHSFLGLTVKDNFKTGKTEIKMTDRWAVHKNLILFIDEASMINKELYDLIHKALGQGSKVIYLGDHCQLAPVFENVSPVYRQPKHTASLTQQMRNSGQPALMQLCADLRDVVQGAKFFPFLEHPGVIDYVSGSMAEAEVQKYFGAHNPDARILAYSNRRVNEYLAHIRHLRGLPELLTQGEVVINNSGIQIGSRMLRVEEEFSIADVDHSIEQIVLNKSDPNAVLEIYRVKLGKPHGEFLDVRVPVDSRHFKELMNYYARLRNWERHFFLKNNFPDLRQRDAATVHKAQGSTYDTVFLDLANIGSCTNADDLARMLYVGASRAKNRLVLFGELPKRLFL